MRTNGYNGTKREPNQDHFKGGGATDAVTPAGVFHTVTVIAEGDGRVSPWENVQVLEGGSQSFSLMPASGYKIEAVYVNGEEQEVVGRQVVLHNITEDTELHVVFSPIVVTPIEAQTQHCLICGWFGRTLAPWCWLAPLIVLALALGLLAWILLKKRRRNR